MDSYSSPGSNNGNGRRTTFDGFWFQVLVQCWWVTGLRLPSCPFVYFNLLGRIRLESLRGTLDCKLLSFLQFLLWKRSWRGSVALWGGIERFEGCHWEWKGILGLLFISWESRIGFRDSRALARPWTFFSWVEDRLSIYWYWWYILPWASIREKEMKGKNTRNTTPSSRMNLSTARPNY